MRFKNTTSAAMVLALSLGLGACGQSDTESSISNDGSEKYGLPSGVDTVVVGTSVGTAPFEFYEGNSSEITGYEPDLLNEIAKRLGVELEWRTSDFTALFTGVEAGRLDMAANGIIDRKSRQEQFDILDYLGDASGIMGKTGSTAAIKTLDDLCGKTLATQSGTSFEDFFRTQSQKCADEGENPIDLVVFKDASGATLAVKSGRADFVANQLILLAYAASQDSSFEVGDLQYLEGLVGMVFPKDSDLIEPMRQVLDEMIADGTYAKILEDWNLGDLALEATALNAGTLG